MRAFRCTSSSSQLKTSRCRPCFGSSGAGRPMRARPQQVRLLRAKQQDTPDDRQGDHLVMPGGGTAWRRGFLPRDGGDYCSHMGDYCTAWSMQLLRPWVPPRCPPPCHEGLRSDY